MSNAAPITPMAIFTQQLVKAARAHNLSIQDFDAAVLTYYAAHMQPEEQQSILHPADKSANLRPEGHATAGINEKPSQAYTDLQQYLTVSGDPGGLRTFSHATHAGSRTSQKFAELFNELEKYVPLAEGIHIDPNTFMNMRTAVLIANKPVSQSLR